jgi:16S rRNA (cytidine1402-2'-O)-methyltransferase
MLFGVHASPHQIQRAVMQHSKYPQHTFGSIPPTAPKIYALHSRQKHYDIQNKTNSYHANSKLSKIDSIIEMLQDGKQIALVSDAGTPIISDPGILLVQEIIKVLPNVRIVPIPGASALLSAVVASGINAHEFTYMGFIPHKKGRETFFKEIADSTRTVVFYESVHRIEKTLESLSAHLDKDRKVVIGRELTKLFEEFVRGNSKEIKEYFKNNKDKIRGEFVVIVEGFKK